MAVFWNVSPCRTVETDRRFGGSKSDVKGLMDFEMSGSHGGEYED